MKFVFHGVVTCDRVVASLFRRLGPSARVLKARTHAHSVQVATDVFQAVPTSPSRETSLLMVWLS